MVLNAKFFNLLRLKQLHVYPIADAVEMVFHELRVLYNHAHSLTYHQSRLVTDERRSIPLEPARYEGRTWNECLCVTGQCHKQTMLKNHANLPAMAFPWNRFEHVCGVLD